MEYHKTEIKFSIARPHKIRPYPGVKNFDKLATIIKHNPDPGSFLFLWDIIKRFVQLFGCVLGYKCAKTYVKRMGCSVVEGNIGDPIIITNIEFKPEAFFVITDVSSALPTNKYQVPKAHKFFKPVYGSYFSDKNKNYPPGMGYIPLAYNLLNSECLKDKIYNVADGISYMSLLGSWKTASYGQYIADHLASIVQTECPSLGDKFFIDKVMRSICEYAPKKDSKTFPLS